MSANALSPPPLCLNENMSQNVSFFSSCIKVYVLKRERPETDDFAIKIYGCEGKILSRNLVRYRN